MTRSREPAPRAIPRKRGESSPQMNAAKVPFVSALLAVRNDAALLHRSLAALMAQDYPAGRMELIVADGGSSDGARSVVEQFASTAPFSVQLLDNPKQSAAAGFNVALSSARGSIIILLGARALPEPSYFSKGVAMLAASGADAVGGVVSATANGVEAEAIGIALSSPFGVGDARYRYSGVAGDVDTVNYGIYRREVFEETGGFDETMENVEDDELNYRLRARGKRLYLSPDIRSGYIVRASLRALALQYARYGYPKARVLRRHPGQMRPRQFAPAALVAALLLGGAGYRRWGFARRLVWLTACSYAAANAASSLVLARRHGWRYLPFLPVAFAAMHFSYGASSLLGTLRFLVWPLLRGIPEPSEVPRIGHRASGGPNRRS